MIDKLYACLRHMEFLTECKTLCYKMYLEHCSSRIICPTPKHECLLFEVISVVKTDVFTVEHQGKEFTSISYSKQIETFLQTLESKIYYFHLFCLDWIND